MEELELENPYLDDYEQEYVDCTELKLEE